MNYTNEYKAKRKAKETGKAVEYKKYKSPGFSRNGKALWQKPTRMIAYPDGTVIEKVQVHA